MRRLWLLHASRKLHKKAPEYSNYLLINVYSFAFVGLPKLLDKYISVIGQPRNVEFEVCELGEAIPGAAILSASLEPCPEPR